MPDYRRLYRPGGTYFFTLVTERRAPLFASPPARTLLGEVMRECSQRYPFKIPAIVLLPDHLHGLWTLPAGDDDFSIRWAFIKANFTR